MWSVEGEGRCMEMEGMRLFSSTLGEKKGANGLFSSAVERSVSSSGIPRGVG